MDNLIVNFCLILGNRVKVVKINILFSYFLVFFNKFEYEKNFFNPEKKNASDFNNFFMFDNILFYDPYFIINFFKIKLV